MFLLSLCLETKITALHSHLSTAAVHELYTPDHPNSAVNVGFAREKVFCVGKIFLHQAVGRQAVPEVIQLATLRLEVSTQGGNCSEKQRRMRGCGGKASMKQVLSARLQPLRRIASLVIPKSLVHIHIDSDIPGFKKLPTE